VIAVVWLTLTVTLNITYVNFSLLVELPKILTDAIETIASESYSVTVGIKVLCVI